MRALLLVLSAFFIAPWVHAAPPQSDLPNACIGSGGDGEACETHEDCAFNAYATRCVQDTGARSCRIPCGADGVASQGLCAIGETCVSGSDGNPYCKASRFRMDLNLLDQCITHFLLGESPALGSTNACSLEANLNRLLDQNGDLRFDVFDLDLCVLSFLDQPVCNAQVGQCPSSDLVYCDSDEVCGAGLYCDPERHFCQRECGLIESRELGIGSLERPCAGFLKACDLERGRCVEADFEGATCTIDRECPNGAYCFLGRCAPQCFRSIDCPDAGWFCTANNRCRPLPALDAEESFVFDPQDYSVLFARESVTLSPLENVQEVPLLVMDLISKREVVDNPSVGFGFRLEVAYDRKVDPVCLRDPALWTEAQIADCLIDDTEEFVTPLSPFGTVFATGRPAVSVRLNAEAAQRLTPGRYSARVRAIFDNGNQNSFVVFFEKTTPSGEYDGSLDVFVGAPRNQLNGPAPIPLQLRLDVHEERAVWHELMQREGLGAESVMRDLNEGFVVHGYLHANDSLPFVLPGATEPGDNEIPVKGLYSPRFGRMRLVAALEIPADLCVGEPGACEGADGVAVRNGFGRHIRRHIELAGTYDDLSRRFFGIYRERISGLIAPSDVTVDGNFVVQQRIPDEAPIELTSPLLPEHAPPTVQFPELQEVLTQVEADIDAHCEGESLPLSFQDAGSYRRYVDGDSFPMLQEVVEFKQLLQDGIDAIGGDPADYLTLYDYLQGQILLCTDVELDRNTEQGEGEQRPPTLDPAACVDEEKLRCGLALQRKAILARFIDVGRVGGARTGSLELFCSAVVPTPGCDPSLVSDAALLTLQEHNRFHQELSQATRFQAGRDLSDAFFALYRHRVNPFTQGTALAYKNDRLASALTHYDSLMELIVGTPAAAVLFDWPMDSFQSRGNLWLDQMQVIVGDRLDALQELVDLRRRVFAGSVRSDQMLAQHLAQQEYLVQVYLTSLQRRWQGDDFAYAGGAAQVFAQLQNILLQLNHSKNPLGITPGQVFFENSRTDRSNWRNYLARLVGDNGGGGLMGRAAQEIDEAVANLQGSLRDLDALESTIFSSTDNASQLLQDLCGDIGPGWEVGSDGALVDPQAKARWLADRDGDGISDSPSDCAVIEAAMARSEPDDVIFDCLRSAAGVQSDSSPALDCGMEFSCELPVAADFIGLSDPCEEVLGTLTAPIRGDSAFTDVVNTLFPGAGEVLQGEKLRCRLDDHRLNSIVVDGKQFHCAGGEMADLLQQLAGQDQARRQVSKEIVVDLMKIRGEVALISANLALFSAQQVIEQIGHATSSLISLFEAADKWGNTAQAPGEVAEAARCVVIGGFSIGTDCTQSVVVDVIQGLLVFVTIVARVAVHGIKSVTEGLVKLAKDAYQFAKEQIPHIKEILGLALGVQAKIETHLAALQSSFDLHMQIENKRFKAADAAIDRRDELSLVIDHLVGRESGNILVGDHLVGESARTFREILDTAYRMTVAFNHRYSLPPGEGEQLVNRILRAVTLDDVQDHIDGLLDYEREYCGREAIDCDAFNNLHIKRISLRETLFPNLRDVVDSTTGAVITRGERFHNIITSPPYLKRRVRGVHTADQIEIPFAVWLQSLQLGDESHWMLNPLTCNHIIDGDSEVNGGRRQGTVAVNVLGRNLGEGDESLHYELLRGHIDQIRACHVEPVQGEIGTDPVLDYPIRTLTVGYAPQSARGQSSSAPSFFTRASDLRACINEGEQDGLLEDASCWQYFGRDRSLAAPDWRLTIPLSVGGGDTGNRWISGDGLPEAARPVIEDIVVYLRHRTRPIQED